MKPEEMKNLWSEMSAEREKQKVLTDKIILTMTKTNYQSKLKKIWIPEIIGAAVCLAAAFYILFNFQKFNTGWLIASGVVSIIILILFSFLSIRSIHRMYSVNISRITFKETLLKFTQRKKEFVFVQKFGFILGALLMVVILPVMSKLISGKNLFAESRLWIWYCVGFVFYYGYYRYVFGHYMRSVSKAELILKELDQA